RVASEAFRLVGFDAPYVNASSSSLRLSLAPGHVSHDVRTRQDQHVDNERGERQEEPRVQQQRLEEGVARGHQGIRNKDVQLGPPCLKSGSEERRSFCRAEWDGVPATSRDGTDADHAGPAVERG